MEENTKQEISAELSALQEQEDEILCWAQKQAESILRIGKALKNIRDGKLYTAKGYENFKAYLDDRAFESLKIGYTQGMKYVSVYETYGNRLHLPPTSNIDVLLELSKMPAEEVEKLEADGKIEGMTTKEAQQLRKELEVANQQISLLNEDIEAAKKENGKLADDIKSAEDTLDDVKEQLSDKMDEIAQLYAEIKELKSRPIEVNAKPSDEDIAEIRKQAEKEAKGAAEKAIEKAKAEADKAISDIITEKTASDERIKELEAKLQSTEKPADEKLIEFKFYFQETQSSLKKFLEVLKKVEDPEQKEKYKGAAKKFVSAILEELDKPEG